MSWKSYYGEITIRRDSEDEDDEGDEISLDFEYLVSEGAFDEPPWEEIIVIPWDRSIILSSSEIERAEDATRYAVIKGDYL